MAKTLYISDLDGTLLNNDGQLSEFTAQALREFTQGGGLFSIATARTWESALHNKFLDPVLPLSVPVVLINGALIYDTQAQRYVKKELIPPDVVHEMLICMKAHNQTGLLYSNKDGVMRIHHSEIADQSFMQKWHDYRKLIYGDRMIKSENLPIHNIVCLSLPNSYDALAPLYEDLQRLPELNSILYPCSYEKDCWYLECFSRQASKHNAAQWLRESYGFDKIVGFGDNLNDLPLFKACDEAYAVANARDELKNVATGIIGANTDDGVAKFLMKQ